MSEAPKPVELDEELKQHEEHKEHQENEELNQPTIEKVQKNSNKFTKPVNASYKDMLIADYHKQRDMFFPQRLYNDFEPDRDPSYTNLIYPYDVTCRVRYVERFKEIDAHIQKDLETLGNYQSSAYNHARYFRVVGITTLWPPLHNRFEMKRFFKYPIPKK